MKLLEFISEPQDFRVRTSLADDGEPLFVGKDVCETLGIANHNDALSRLDDDERALIKVTKGVGSADPLGGAQSTVCVTESGLYALIFQSRKPEAKAFRKWVTSEVLPALRRDGSYTLAGKLPFVAIRVQQAKLKLRAAQLRENARYLDQRSVSVAALPGGVPILNWVIENRPELNPKQRANMTRNIKHFGEAKGYPVGAARVRSAGNDTHQHITMLPEHIEAYFTTAQKGAK
jgi:prophage antirepressor-like protein